MARGVRPIARADADAWLRMRLALWPESSAAELGQEIAAYFAGTLREPEAVLVAEEDGALVGFAELSIRSHAEGCDSGRVAYLEGWFVDEPRRGRGLGRSLVAAAEDWGRGQGCTEFASDTNVANDGSVAAHRALGFDEVDTIRCFRKSLG